MQFNVLGPLSVLDDGGGPIRLGGRKPRALLAQLLLRPNEAVSTDRLIDALWGESPPASAGSALQVHVHALRKALGADRILTRAPGYLARVEADELDVQRFERLVTEGKPREALALWRGPALAEFAGESFAQAEAARLEDARLAALEDRIAADLDAGRHHAVTAELEALVVVHPHRERFRSQHMLALYRAGRQADALAAYRDARAALDELGLAPSAELRALERRILEQDASLDAPADRVDAPKQPGGLIGRDRELAAVTALLRRTDIQLVTLTGTGGAGKTRLAVAAADEVGGAVFVDLAPLSDPALVLSAVARALAIDEAPSTPLVEIIAEAVAASPKLVLLDNLEHLQPAFASLGELLRAAPGLRVLATSRVPLRLAGEREYRVPPLAVPALADDAPDDLARNASVKLYVERARAAVPSFGLTTANAPAVARICRALDGLPLAIEIAAARIRVLGPDGTAKRLGERLALLTREASDLPERQRSVRGAIDWSYKLLEPGQQSTFRALGVFAGAVGLDAVEDIVGADGTPDALEALLDAGLVVHSADGSGEPRFGLLETLRAYALAELEQTGELAARRTAHAARYLAFVEGEEAARAGASLSPEALSRLDSEHAEILAALGATEPDLDTNVRLVIALREYWRVRGLFDEATLQLERAVERLPEPVPASAAMALAGAAFFAYYRGDWERAGQHGERALATFQRTGDRVWTARMQQLLAGTATAQGELRRARELCGDAAAFFRETENWYGLALVLGSISEANRRLGDLDAARDAISEALTLRRAHGDESLYSFGLVVLAGLASEAGDLAEAVALIAESLPLAVELEALDPIPPNLFIAARVAVSVRDAERAALLLGAAERALRRLGDDRYEHERAEYFDPVDAAAAALIGAERTAELREAGRALDLDDAVTLATGIDVAREPSGHGGPRTAVR